MSSKFAMWLAAGVAVIGLAVTFSTAAKAENHRYDERGRFYYGRGGPNAVYHQGARTRLYVSKRSWLDGGTNVNPGDRKFSDYAFPPEVGAPSFARQNGNHPIDRAPLSPPSDLGGYPTTFPLY
ncbi:MAG: hypothetical protein FWD68_08730 [Alphaproteobacteria bacterium]|nr:hypothetical protein [Alphaproteobacteria bacterium]